MNGFFAVFMTIARPFAEISMPGAIGAWKLDLPNFGKTTKRMKGNRRKSLTAVSAANPATATGLSSELLPAAFYHGTSWENWRRIRHAGLTLPSENRRANYRGGLAARHDAVYLTTCFAGVYAANAALHGDYWNRLVLLEVNVTGLSSAELIGDEDGETIAGVSMPSPGSAGCGDDWRRSLDSVGNIACRRAIPRAFIRRAVLLDMRQPGQLGNILVAAVPRPGYYAVHGKKYNLIMRRLFGETVSGAEIYAAENDRCEPARYIEFWDRPDLLAAVTELKF